MYKYYAQIMDGKAKVRGHMNDIERRKDEGELSVSSQTNVMSVLDFFLLYGWTLNERTFICVHTFVFFFFWAKKNSWPLFDYALWMPLGDISTKQICSNHLDNISFFFGFILNRWVKSTDVYMESETDVGKNLYNIE